MYNTDSVKERVILVSIEDEKPDMNADNCLDELELLAQTSGADVAGRLIQNREKAHPAHYLGKGKIDELKDLISLKEATGIICDDELTNAQHRNMEKMLDTKIMDRTMLILDIFAGRANTAEGKVQVELAQYKYNLSHLAGLGTVLSRLGGGIGTRGPGEKKLEMDRRNIRRRITELDDELKEIEKMRGVLRERRKKNGTPIVAMVGYTNAGKSTLMNALTGAGVYVEDQPFATLDTTTRKLELSGGAQILFTDTVGFIQKLPHNLIQAFRATLEELRFADVLVHVVDASSPVASEQISVVYDTLKELECLDKPVITVFNKIDRLIGAYPGDTFAQRTVKLSALTGEGVDNLKTTIEDVLKSFRKKLCVLIPYNAGNIVNQVHGSCEIEFEEHREEGTYMELYAKEDMAGKLNMYIIYNS